MFRYLVPFSLLLASSVALKCNSCAVFNTTSMTEYQQGKISNAFTMLRKPMCEDKSQTNFEMCTSSQDECQKILVTSKLEGETAYEGYLLQCGMSGGRSSFCGIIMDLAELAGFKLESCEMEGCNGSDKCFPIPGSSSSAPGTASSLLMTFLLLTLNALF